MNQFTKQGTPISYGIGVGRAFVLSIPKGISHSFVKNSFIVEKEIHRYKKAVGASIHDLQEIQRQLKDEKALDGLAVIDSHLKLLEDPLLTTDIEVEIRKTKKNSLSVLHKVVGRYQQKFLSLEDPFFRERFKDIQDVADRVMNHLQHRVQLVLSHLPTNAVLFAQDLTPSEVAAIKPGTVAAIVTKRGSKTSHAAIIAKSKGIPYVASLDFNTNQLAHEQLVIVDGRKGEVIFNPELSVVKKFTTLKKKWFDKTDTHHQSTHSFAHTKDGCEVRLYLNIDTPHDLDQVPENSAGVGLFRTEFLITPEKPFPNEETQYKIYRNLLHKFPNKPVAIRVFDFGGEKGKVVNEHFTESNPALGFRAIRFLLKEKKIFHTQVRALLRASVEGDLRILLPMITSMEELRESKKMIEEVQEILIQESIPCKESIPIGSMVEVPSAALMIDHLAKESDFLAFGTNDLTQYTLAVDRSNHLIANLYTPFHPSLLRLLKQMMKESAKHQVPTCICGEIGADPCYIPLLLGLGIREISLNKHYFPMIKDIIEKSSIKKCQSLVKKTLLLSSSKEIEALATHFYHQLIPEEFR